MFKWIASAAWYTSHTWFLSLQLLVRLSILCDVWQTPYLIIQRRIFFLLISWMSKLTYSAATKDTEDKTRHQIQVNTKTRHQILLPSKHIKVRYTYTHHDVLSPRKLHLFSRLLFCRPVYVLVLSAHWILCSQNPKTCLFCSHLIPLQSYIETNLKLYTIIQDFSITYFLIIGLF